MPKKKLPFLCLISLVRYFVVACSFTLKNKKVKWSKIKKQPKPTSFPHSFFCLMLLLLHFSAKCPLITFISVVDCFVCQSFIHSISYRGGTWDRLTVYSVYELSGSNTLCLVYCVWLASKHKVYIHVDCKEMACASLLLTASGERLLHLCFFLNQFHTHKI